MSTRTASLLHRVVRIADAWAAPHGIDRYIEQVVPTWSSTEVRGRVVAIDRSVTDTTMVTIRPNRNWTGFQPGQHTQLTVEIDGVRHTRCYSMSSGAPIEGATDEGTFELGIKAHPDGRVSNFCLDALEVGTVVGLTPAMGEFHLPAERPDRILLVSGGSGITPVLSMLRTLVAGGHTGPIGFLHYNRTPEHQIARHEVRAIADAHPNVTVIQGYESGDGEVEGLLDDSHLAAADPAWSTAETYVCGPAPLMAAVQDRFAAADAAERVHQEAFTLATALAEAPDATGTVSFARSGPAVGPTAAEGRTILETAEAAGLAPTAGCRMGICHTCVADLCAGSVRNVVTGEVTTADPATTATSVRICVNAPVSDVTVTL